MQGTLYVKEVKGKGRGVFSSAPINAGEVIKDKEKLAVRTDSVSQSRQTVPASVVSVP